MFCPEHSHTSSQYPFSSLTRESAYLLTGLIESLYLTLLRVNPSSDPLFRLRARVGTPFGVSRGTGGLTLTLTTSWYQGGIQGTTPSLAGGGHRTPSNRLTP